MDKEEKVIGNPFECWKKGCKTKPFGLKQFNPDFWRTYSCRYHAKELNQLAGSGPSADIDKLFKYLDETNEKCPD